MPSAPEGQDTRGKVERRRRSSLHTRLLAGLVLGAAAGILSNRWLAGSAGLEWVVDNVAGPVGQIFLRLLFMVVVPLVFTSLALGVAGLGDLGKLGRMGAKTLGLFLCTTALAATLGLLLVNAFEPGRAMDATVRAALLAEYAPAAGERVAAAEATGFGPEMLVNAVPRNPVEAAARGDMLALIVFTLLFGLALTRLPREVAAPVLRVLEGVGQAVAVMIGFAMRLAPYGVAALIFGVTARFGFGLLDALGAYVAVVLAGLALHQLAVIPALVHLLAGVRPLDFFRRSRTVILTAFSTSSSNATLPTTIRTAEEAFGVPREVAGFVLPLGATMNMNGTALFEGVTVLFLAQVFGVDLSVGAQAAVVALSVITALGAAGVPGGSIPLLVLVLETVGVPGAGIGLILGVDRLLDMARTVPNVTGDLFTSLAIARSEARAAARSGSALAPALPAELLTPRPPPAGTMPLG